MAARGAQRAEREELLPREDDLSKVVERPLAARAGAVKTPNEVAAELDEAYRGVRLRFVLTWFAVALPVGLALGFIPRPASMS